MNRFDTSILLQPTQIQKLDHIVKLSSVVGGKKWMVVLLLSVELLLKTNPSSQTLRETKRPRHNVMEIHGLVWKKHNNVLMLNKLLWSLCIKHKTYHTHYCEGISITNMFCRIVVVTKPFSYFPFTTMIKYYFIQKNYKDWFDLQREQYIIIAFIFPRHFPTRFSHVHWCDSFIFSLHTIFNMWSIQ